MCLTSFIRVLLLFYFLSYVIFLIIFVENNVKRERKLCDELDKIIENLEKRIKEDKDADGSSAAKDLTRVEYESDVRRMKELKRLLSTMLKEDCMI